jgi:electron-transferring-flavoprotein dehydrogenase
LIGCSAGFLNVAKIKGTHNAMKSGMLAADAAFDVITSLPGVLTTPADMSAYSTALKNSWVHSELHEVRNLRPSFNTALGMFGGIAYSGIDSLILKGRTPWTFRNRKKLTDAQHTQNAARCKPIEYPPPVPPLSTDLLTALALTGTNHAEDQLVHLRVVGPAGKEGPEVRREHVKRNVKEYAGLLGRACPAAVYEYVDEADEQDQEAFGGKKLVINSQVGRPPLGCLSACATLIETSDRTAFIANCAISNFRRRILRGRSQKAEEVRSIVSCSLRLRETNFSLNLLCSYNITCKGSCTFKIS